MAELHTGIPAGISTCAKAITGTLGSLLRVRIKYYPVSGATLSDGVRSRSVRL